ncbi:hypothetical protein SAMN02982929_03285 [Saccharopolyspora kobensis]|uniref:Uncharacterized protein n=1 Tax=Saccharopolyspora kobensis TaxID=146035 RepID=A0A1H6CB39_9PSEU|nr:hypothetical protein [Saccharopolyspora kobensis]SEG70191.1 hypothetical protein SAMN02982929_03285 [Saccharopolyspora kobensis]SFC34376.1 hypothetical protein SAMN05216506_101527 [Saccharopolyspora kobensis]
MRLADGTAIENPTRHEELLAGALSELREHPAIDVLRDTLVVQPDAIGADAMPAAKLAAESMEAGAMIADLSDVVVDPAIAESAPRFGRFAGHWRASDEAAGLAGEFRLPYFFGALFEPAPPLAWEGTPDDERELLAQFREIDGHPRAGTGLIAAVRVEPHRTPLEIWVWDARIGPLQMDLDYLGYLEALALTKGTFGWQYLFTRASLASVDFRHTAKDMATMLRVFPELFPNHDYAPLRARLEARL